jgi:hypothetical protein
MLARGDIATIKGNRIFRRLRPVTIVAALALAAFAVVATSLREHVLRAAGWALVINDEPVWLPKASRMVVCY